MRPGDVNVNVDDFVQGVLNQDRAKLAKAITLMENQRPDLQAVAGEVLEKLLPHSGKSFRIGISGVPGVGKSTFIENLGLSLIEKGHKVAVLAVDPSSSLTGGSILGDKTRMERLSQSPHSFIRPSPTVGALGGVTYKTRESIFLCEAAGFDIVMVETVGVGQSEIRVADMVDLLVVMLLPGAGDELQGIKRGILEVADLLVVHKADGDNKTRAALAKKEYETALHILKGDQVPKVINVSSLTREGFPALESFLTDFQSEKEKSSLFLEKRKSQQKKWMWELIENGLKEKLKNHPRLKKDWPELERKVLAGEISPQRAAGGILEIFP